MPQSLSSTGKPMILSGCIPSDQSDVGFVPEKPVYCLTCRKLRKLTKQGNGSVKLHRPISRLMRLCPAHWPKCPQCGLRVEEILNGSVCAECKSGNAKLGVGQRAEIRALQGGK